MAAASRSPSWRPCTGVDGSPPRALGGRDGQLPVRHETRTAGCHDQFPCQQQRSICAASSAVVLAAEQVHLRHYLGASVAPIGLADLVIWRQRGAANRRAASSLSARQGIHWMRSDVADALAARMRIIHERENFYRGPGRAEGSAPVPQSARPASSHAARAYAGGPPTPRHASDGSPLRTSFHGPRSQAASDPPWLPHPDRLCGGSAIPARARGAVELVHLISFHVTAGDGGGRRRSAAVRDRRRCHTEAPCPTRALMPMRALLDSHSCSCAH